MVAQALAEKGALDSAVTGISTVFSQVGDAVQANPYVFIGIAIVAQA